MDWLGYWDEFVQKARFKKLVCLHHINQSNLTYLGGVCTPCLFVSIRIYGESEQKLKEICQKVRKCSKNK